MAGRTIAVTGISELAHTDDGGLVVVEFETAAGEPVRLGFPFEAMGMLLGHMMQAAQGTAAYRAGQGMADGLDPEGEFAALRVTAVQAGPAADGRSLLLSLGASGVRFDFDLPKTPQWPDGRLFLDVLADGIARARAARPEPEPASEPEQEPD